MLFYLLLSIHVRPLFFEKYKPFWVVANISEPLSMRSTNPPTELLLQRRIQVSPLFLENSIFLLSFGDILISSSPHLIIVGMFEIVKDETLFEQ